MSDPRQKPSDAEIHRRVMEKLRAMTSDERIQSLVDAGVLTEDRKIAEIYRTEPVLSYREPLSKKKSA